MSINPRPRRCVAPPRSPQGLTHRGHAIYARLGQTARSVARPTSGTKRSIGLRRHGPRRDERPQTRCHDATQAAIARDLRLRESAFARVGRPHAHPGGQPRKAGACCPATSARSSGRVTAGLGAVRRRSTRTTSRTQRRTPRGSHGRRLPPAGLSASNRASQDPESGHPVGVPAPQSVRDDSASVTTGGRSRSSCCARARTSRTRHSSVARCPPGRPPRRPRGRGSRRRRGSPSA